MKESLGRRLVHRRPSPSMVIACLALAVALSGAGYAAIVLPANSVGTLQLKRNAVKSSKVALNTLKGVDIKESTLGRVPSAANATNAANAANADKLDGVDSTQFLFRTGQSGQTLSGQIAARYVANSSFTLAQASYPVPLPATVADPTLEFLASGAAPTATCPGIGQATSGRLCVYSYNEVNIASVSFGGSFFGPNAKLYGFSLDVFPTSAASAAFVQANWAYQIP
jgi:hypothetical protein